MTDYVICGIVATCNRPADHRGHHGGWRADGDTLRRPRPKLRGEVYGEPLSTREIEVLRAFAEYGRMDVAANTLSISTQTMKNHLTKIYAKLGATCSTDAFRLVGWLDTGAQPRY